MQSDGVTVTWRMARLPPSSERAMWDSLTPRFAGEMLHPERVELVITDQYETVAGEYAIQSPVRANPAETAADYQALKPDGAMAAARTVALPNGALVVVAAFDLARLGRERAWRILLHEAQHVRLHQDGDVAWGVHRRATFELPADLDFGFIWMAEIVIDEFRCERAVNEAGVPLLDMGSDIADYDDIVASFEGIRRQFRRASDVLAAYQGATTVLQRLGQFLAYGAAHIVLDPPAAATWSTVPSMADILDVLSEIPSAGRRVEDDRLATHCIEVARMLRKILQGPALIPTY